MEERGIYITALCHCWIEDGLKAGSRVVEAWLKQSPCMASCFTLVDGKYRNPRLDKERQKQLEWRKKLSDSGRKGVESKRVKTRLKRRSSQAKARLKPGITSSSSSSSSIEDSRESSNKADNTGPLFEELWKSWPSEGRFKKKYCLAKFEALCKAGKLEEFKATHRGYLKFLEYQESEQNFKQRAMHLSTFLNNWEGDKERYIGFDRGPRL